MSHRYPSTLHFRIGDDFSLKDFDGDDRLAFVLSDALRQLGDATRGVDLINAPPQVVTWHLTLLQKVRAKSIAESLLELFLPLKESGISTYGDRIDISIELSSKGRKRTCLRASSELETTRPEIEDATKSDIRSESRRFRTVDPKPSEYRPRDVKAMRGTEVSSLLAQDIESQDRSNRLARSRDTCKRSEMELETLDDGVAKNLHTLAQLRGAARFAKVTLASVRKAVKRGRLRQYQLGDGTLVVSLQECQRVWPDGAKPGRPRKDPTQP